MTLAQILKQKRIEAGLKQKELAEQFGWTSGQYISNFERGIAKPPLKDAKKLCKLLGIDPEAYKDIVFDEFEQEIERAFS